MLVHQASWATLRKCIHKLLATRDVDAFEAKVVLDFLTALIKVPKLWQGREKHVPKHQQPEELLNLNHQQVSLDPFTPSSNFRNLLTFSRVDFFLLCSYFDLLNTS